MKNALPTYKNACEGGSKDLQKQYEVMEKSLHTLNQGLPARKTQWADAGQQRIFKILALLTGKPTVYVCNVDEDSVVKGNIYSHAVMDKAKAEGAECVIISAGIEAEISQIDDPADQAAFLADLGLQHTGLTRVIQAGYNTLNHITFFTVGPKEARAWTVTKGATAPNAAGVIHGDFERGFICADTITYDDYVALGGEAAAKDAGKIRQEGKSYIVQDGDIFHFKFNV